MERQRMMLEEADRLVQRLHIAFFESTAGSVRCQRVYRVLSRAVDRRERRVNAWRRVLEASRV